MLVANGLENRFMSRDRPQILYHLVGAGGGADQEQAKAIGQGASSTMDPQWAGPALAEAWCYAKISLSNGNLDRPSATTIITAIGGCEKKRASS